MDTNTKRKCVGRFSVTQKLAFQPLAVHWKQMQAGKDERKKIDCLPTRHEGTPRPRQPSDSRLRVGRSSGSSHRCSYLYPDLISITDTLPEQLLCSHRPMCRKRRHELTELRRRLPIHGYKPAPSLTSDQAL